MGTMGREVLIERRVGRPSNPFEAELIAAVQTPRSVHAQQRGTQCEDAERTIDDISLPRAICLEYAYSEQNSDKRE